MQRLIVAGNWKMHGDRAMVDAYARELAACVEGSDHAGVGVWLFPPAPYLLSLANALAEAGAKEVSVGVQNVHEAASGAFTGEMSAAMAADCGAQLVLVGHSERRTLFGESDELVAAKARAVIDAGLTPVICVGESLDERRGGEAMARVRAQLEPVLASLAAGEVERSVIAYEPVWAIGTGETATPEIAQEMHAGISEHLLARKISARPPILYGGSVKASNAEQLFAQPDIDGALVGGASLAVTDFAGIIAAAQLKQNRA
ncbi:MAG: triose-phosphate isomerase [Pseudomonadaceae bacterium]|nr:triose-phosphate isomerase [Pseudomonadaceae bacterium]